MFSPSKVVWRWYQFVPDQYSVPHLRFWTVQPDSRIFSFPKYNVWDAVPLFVVLFHETVLGVDLHSLHTPCALLAQRFQTCLHYTHNSLQLPVAHFVRLNSVLQLLPACLHGFPHNFRNLKVCTGHPFDTPDGSYGLASAFRCAGVSLS